MRSEREVVVVVYDGFDLLDLAGPTDVLHAATLLGPDHGYRLVLASPSGGPVRSDSGITVHVDTAVSRAGGPQVDTLLVIGGLEAHALLARHPGLDDDLRLLAGRSRRVASVCTGALILAGAGLLDGRRATTHWAACDELRTRHPQISVEPDAIHVRDGDRWTSAGVTAGIDLALALVDADHGGELAHAVAGWLVVFLRRPGGQSQFSAHLRSTPARTPALVELQRWLPDHLADDLGVEVLAARAGMSPRNFARLFRREVGVTPGHLVESLRLEAAKNLLETTDLGMHAIAGRVGLGRPETLHRLFARRTSTTPGQYRQHFRRPSASAGSLAPSHAAPN